MHNPTYLYLTPITHTYTDHAPTPLCSWIAPIETRRKICIRTVEHRNPKSNSAINKHKNDTNITFSTIIQKITEILLIKQHNPPLNNISNLITYTIVPCI